MLAEFFGKLFVRGYERPQDPVVRERYGVMASVVGILINLLLFALKFLIGILTASIAIQADAMNNLSDAGASVISFVSFRIAARPADREHPFGHARLEYIASMIVSFLILLIGVEFFTESVGKIRFGSETTFTWLAVSMLAIAIGAKLWLFFFYRSVGKKIDSDVMRATAQDSLSDVVSTSVVLLSLFVFRWSGLQVDGYMGLLVSVFILVAGFKILWETKNHILGTAPDPALLSDIEKMALAPDEVLGIHDVIAHNYGAGKWFVSFHAEVDGKADVFVVHDAIDNLEKQIGETLGVQCIIHMDPIVTDDAAVSALRDSVAAAVAEIDARLTIHDFRFVVGQTHSNLIFDVVVPFEVTWSSDEVRARVTEQVKVLDPTYRAVITIDRS